MKILRSTQITMLLIALCLYSAGSFSADTMDDSRETDRAALRQILAQVEEGINKRDFNIIKPHLAPHVIVTFLNAEMTSGIDGAEKYMNRMFQGADAVLKSYSTKATVDQPAIFYGDTAVAAGYTSDNFSFSDGLGFELHTRWTTTVVKEGDAWKIASLHFSSNMFDNPLLNQARKSNLYYAIAGIVLGILAILVVSWIRRKKS